MFCIGLVNIDLGIVIEPKIVKVGSSVKLTCLWEDNDDSKWLYWYRRTSATNITELLWEVFLSHDLSANSSARPEFTSKFEHYDLVSYRRHHAIVLLEANSKDEGEYWCEMVILNKNYTSPRATLEVSGA